MAVAARGCLPPVANVFVAALTPAIRSPTDILMITTMALVWTVNSKGVKFQNSIILPLQILPPAPWADTPPVPAATVAKAW